MAHIFDTNLRFTGATSPLASNYTCGAGSTVLVLGIVTGGSTARAGGAPTYNGVALTQAGSTQKAAASPETVVEMFYLLAPPTGSSLSISVPNTGTASLFVQASTYKSGTGISALDIATGGNNTGTNPLVAITTGSDGCAIVAVVGSGAQTWAPSARNGTQLNDTDDGSFGDGNQYLMQSAHGAQNMGWTFGTSEDWAIVVAAFKETLVVNVNNTSAVTESVSLNVPGYSLSVNKSDSTTITENVVRLIENYVINVSDSSAVTENVVLLVENYAINVSDSSAVTESVTVFINETDTPSINVSDSTTITENITVFINETDTPSINVSDSSTITEDIVISLTGGLFIVNVSDSTTVTDSTTQILEGGLSVSDSTTVTDSTSLSLPLLLLSVSDSSTLSEVTA
ncbi:MAG TPA: hypothetical protein VLF39_04685, partial [Candidatus Saccharimonadales bacterium]|nr:hypothetical protein [Candidatus Saccharimonadales bacterium]